MTFPFLGDDFVRTVDVLAADVGSGSFKVDPEQMRAIISQLANLSTEMNTASTHTRGQIPPAMPPTVNSINVEADSTWNTLATGAKEQDRPSLSTNMEDLGRVVTWLHAALANAFSAYENADSQSAAAMSKAAQTDFNPGGSAATIATPGASAAPSGPFM